MGGMRACLSKRRRRALQAGRGGSDPRARASVSGEVLKIPFDRCRSRGRLLPSGFGAGRSARLGQRRSDLGREDQDAPALPRRKRGGPENSATRRLIAASWVRSISRLAGADCSNRFKKIRIQPGLPNPERLSGPNRCAAQPADRLGPLFGPAPGRPPVRSRPGTSQLPPD